MATWLQPAPAVTCAPPEMTDGERIRAHVFTAYLSIALRVIYAAKHGDTEDVPIDDRMTELAFAQARDELSIRISVDFGSATPHLLAGITQNQVATLLFDAMGLGYTNWRKVPGLTLAKVLAAIQKVHNGMDVTSM